MVSMYPEDSSRALKVYQEHQQVGRVAHQVPTFEIEGTIISRLGIGTVWSGVCLCKAYTEAQGRGTRPVSDVSFSPDLARSEAGPVPRPCAAVYGSTNPTHSMYYHYRQLDA
eukprot:scaffold5015_cov46-Phaeocystis_antarctica.AAC.1